MRRVLVVREFDDFSRILSEHGFSVINCPTVTTMPLEDTNDLTTKLKNIEDYDGIFLTSRAAAKILVGRLSELQIKPSCEIYVLGSRSFELLSQAQCETVFFPEANTAREMLAAIPAEKLRGKKFLFVRGVKSLRAVPDFLGEIAEVIETVVYRTENIPIGDRRMKKLAEMFEQREIGCVVFFSPSGAESFLKQCGGLELHQTKTAAIGRTTADFLENQGLRADFIAPKARAEDFADALAEYLKTEERKA